MPSEVLVRLAFQHQGIQAGVPGTHASFIHRRPFGPHKGSGEFAPVKGGSFCQTGSVKTILAHTRTRLCLTLHHKGRGVRLRVKPLHEDVGTGVFGRQFLELPR